MNDPRLMAYDTTPGDQPNLARISWDAQRRCHIVKASGTKTLGYVYPINLNADGAPTKPHVPTYGIPVPDESLTVRVIYQATDRHDAKLDDPVDTVEDAAALIVGAAHSDNPDPQHQVPRNVGGRPVEIVDGQTFLIKFPRALLERVDAAAREAGLSRAGWLRQVAESALTEGYPA